MKLQQPLYYRARLKAVRQMISNSQTRHSADNATKNSPSELLKNGVVHQSLKGEFDSILKSTIDLMGKNDNAPLSFEEIASFSTWFVMHPHKVAGQEIISSSLYFPVTIKGTKEDIISVVSKELQSGIPSKVRIARAKAAAKLKILQLVNL